jgi:hypothetical protein
MIPIEPEQEVAENPQFKTSVGGAFDPLDFVPCQQKVEETKGTCAFLAESVTGQTHESGI